MKCEVCNVANVVWVVNIEYDWGSQMYCVCDNCKVNRSGEIGSQGAVIGDFNIISDKLDKNMVCPICDKQSFILHIIQTDEFLTTSYRCIYCGISTK